MNLTHRLAAGFALVAAPAVIFLGTATAHADTTGANNVSTSSHQAFPHQHNTPQPGTSIHHHHQRNR